MSTPTPIIPHDSWPTFRSEQEVFGTDLAMSASSRQPNVVLDNAGLVSLPLFLHLAEPHGARSGEPLSLYVLVAPYTPYRRTSVASASLQYQAVPQRSGPVSPPTASHHVFEHRWRLSIAGFHSRRPAGCVWFHFFPRSVGFGPTDSCAKGAFTMAPSMLCHAHATPSRSSYSASPLRHRRTKTPLRFQSRKYLWIELALPNRSSGSAFHWHPVRNTYTMPSNTRRGSIGLRPPPGRRRYFRPFSRLQAGISGSAFAHSSSETIHERVVVMRPSCPMIPKCVNIIIYG